MCVCFFSTNISILDCTDLYLHNVLHILWSCKYCSPPKKVKITAELYESPSIHFISHHQASPLLPLHASVSSNELCTLHRAFELTLSKSFTLINNRYEASVASGKNGTASATALAERVFLIAAVPQMPPLRLFVFVFAFLYVQFNNKMKLKIIFLKKI